MTESPNMPAQKTHPESLASVRAAEVEWERAAARDAKAAAGPFAAGFLTVSVRWVIAAWVAAKASIRLRQARAAATPRTGSLIPGR